MRLIALGTTVVILLFMFVAPASSDNAAQSPIKVQAELLNLHVRDETGQHKTIQKLIVLLVNTGTQPVTVVTENLEQGTDDDDGATKFTIGLNTKVEKDGHLIVPSLSKLAPVTLQPGEAAQVSTDSIDTTFLLREFKGGKINVSYEVTDFWGKRLSIWSGVTASDAVVK